MWRNTITALAAAEVVDTASSTTLLIINPTVPQPVDTFLNQIVLKKVKLIVILLYLPNEMLGMRIQGRNNLIPLYHTLARRRIISVNDNIGDII